MTTHSQLREQMMEGIRAAIIADLVDSGAPWWNAADDEIDWTELAVIAADAAIHVLDAAEEHRRPIFVPDPLAVLAGVNPQETRTHV